MEADGHARWFEHGYANGRVGLNSHGRGFTLRIFSRGYRVGRGRHRAQ